MPLPIPVFYPLAEIANRFHVTPRRLREHLRAYPIGRRIGPQILFTEADVLALIESLELVGGGRARYRPAQASQKYIAATSDSALQRALALCAEEKEARRQEQKRRRHTRRSGSVVSTP